MLTTLVPPINRLYWLTLAAASVFGTNTGDFLSHTLQLGNYRGLPVLAVLFAGILLVGRRSRVSATRYWLAIIVLRTAATNLADLSTLQWEFGYQAVIVALAALLVIILLAGGVLRAAHGATPAAYWGAMLTAATLGTVLGDFGSHTLTLRVSALVSLSVFAATLAWQPRATTDTVPYWCLIVMARTAGTNIGDLLAFKKGLNLGLPASTLLTGLAFCAAVAVAVNAQRGAPILRLSPKIL